MVSPDESAYLGGSVVLVTAVPAVGWEFASWNEPWQEQGHPLSITIDEDVTVTATFVPRQHIIELFVEEGSGDVTVQPAKEVYDFEENVMVTAVADTGWGFAGWSGDLSGSGNPANAD